MKKKKQRFGRNNVTGKLLSNLDKCSALKCTKETKIFVKKVWRKFEKSEKDTVKIKKEKILTKNKK